MRPCKCIGYITVGVFFNASAAFTNNCTGQVTPYVERQTHYDNFLWQLAVFCQFYVDFGLSAYGNLLCLISDIGEYESCVLPEHWKGCSFRQCLDDPFVLPPG